MLAMQCAGTTIRCNKEINIFDLNTRVRMKGCIKVEKIRSIIISLVCTLSPGAYLRMGKVQYPLPKWYAKSKP